MPRIHVPLPLKEGSSLELPPAAARHVQVLRLQPGMTVTLFDGRGGEHAATIERMGRNDVAVLVGPHDPVERELAVQVTIALGMPANDRMDSLVEKATELGVARLQPLECERSVLRLAGERAQRRREHWQAIAVSASEQSRRTRVPLVEPVRTLQDWLADVSANHPARWLLSFGEDAMPVCELQVHPVVELLSGPEGGLSPAEEAAARAAGFRPVTLGARVLRADTAPLALLGWLGLR